MCQTGIRLDIIVLFIIKVYKTMLYCLKILNRSHNFNVLNMVDSIGGKTSRDSFNRLYNIVCISLGKISYLRSFKSSNSSPSVFMLPLNFSALLYVIQNYSVVKDIVTFYNCNSSRLFIWPHYSISIILFLNICRHKTYPKQSFKVTITLL
jgi:hypothetical protein